MRGVLSKLFAANPFRRKKKDLPEEFRKKMRQSAVSAGETVNDIFSSAALHRQLLVAYHPDRQLDEKKKIIAEELCKEINQNSHNYKKLKELEALCRDLLGSMGPGGQ